MLTWNQIVLALAAITAGAINSVAGGGTLLTYPALYTTLGATAVAAVWANATSTAALVPGSLASAWGYRTEMRRLPRWAWLLLAPSLAGGILGSELLVLLPPDVFKILVPWLILTAALLFAMQPQVTRWMISRAAARHRAETLSRAVAGETGAIASAVGGLGGSQSAPAALPPVADIGPQNLALVLTIQFFVSIYCGYFGAGAGILMLATFGFMGLEDIHEMNSLKTLLGATINGVSVVVFAYKHVINWPLALLMAIAAIAGGYAGASIARRLNRDVVRKIVVTVGVAMAAYCFYMQWRTG